MSEYFDIFDETFEHVGSKRREDVHRDGDWHQVFHCWVIGRERDGETFVVLQKRTEDKDMYPGKIDISAAGHLEAGETVRDGIRELEEELGLRVRFEDLIPLGHRIGIQKDNGLLDRQICHVFFYECDRPLDAYDYQKDEISGLLKLPIAAGLRLFSGELDSVSVDSVGFGVERVAISAEDFIHSDDQYTVRALILARRYFSGETNLLI